MDDDAFEAHLALHGLVRYTGFGMNYPDAHNVVRVYVADEHLIDMFRMRGFVRIDQYSTDNLLRVVEARRIPGFQEFGCCGRVIFYTRKK